MFSNNVSYHNYFIQIAPLSGRVFTLKAIDLWCRQRTKRPAIHDELFAQLTPSVCLQDWRDQYPTQYFHVVYTVNVYREYWLPWLMIAWRSKEPRHQQSWYWFRKAGIFSTRRVDLPIFLFVNLRCQSPRHLYKPAMNGSCSSTGTRLIIIWYVAIAVGTGNRSWVSKHIVQVTATHRMPTDSTYLHLIFK